MQPSRATPKAPATDPELVRAARAFRRGLTWTAAGIALLLGDALAPDRKGRQKKRKDRP